MGSSWLLFWLILLGSPNHPLITLADILPDSFPSGSDIYEFFWKCIITAAYLGIFLFAIFIWTKVLAVKPPVYQVNLQQISNKIKTVMDENAEIVQKITIWEQKTNEYKKCIKESKRKINTLSNEANKFKDNIKTLEGSNEMLNRNIESIRFALNFKRNEKIKNHILRENASLRNKKDELQEEIEGQRKEHSELLEKSKYLENKQKDLDRVLTEKDNNIAALTNCISQLNESYESKFEDKSLDINEVLTDVNGKMKIQTTEMMDVSQAKTAISALEDDLEELESKLSSIMTTKCKLEKYQKQLEDECKSLRSVKDAKEEECKSLSRKLEVFDEIYVQRKMSAEKELEHEEHRRQKTQKQLSAAEERSSLATEEIENYKQKIEEMEQKLQQAENSFRQEIAFHEKKEHDNWIRVQDLERVMFGQTREAAYLKRRLEIIQNKKAQEECGIKTPMPGRFDVQNSPWRGPSAALPVQKNSSSRSSFPAKMMEEGKDNMAASGPSPFQGSPFMHYPMGGLPPPLMGSPFMHYPMGGLPPPLMGSPFMHYPMGGLPPPLMGYWRPPSSWWPHPLPPPPPFGKMK